MILTFGSSRVLLKARVPRSTSRMVEATGFEPTTAWLQTRCSTN